MTNIVEIDQLILMHLPLNAINAMRQVNHYLNEISTYEYFWKQKCLQDFGPITHINPANVLYKDYYIELYKQQYPKVTHAENAAEAGRISELNWLLCHNIKPTHRGANRAARNANLETLKWLASIDVYADINGANWAAARNHLQIVQWLAAQDVYPDNYGIETAAKNECKEVLAWLMSLLP